MRVLELKAKVFDLIKQAEKLMVQHQAIQQEVAKLNAEIERLERVEESVDSPE